MCMYSVDCRYDKWPAVTGEKPCLYQQCKASHVCDLALCALKVPAWAISKRHLHVTAATMCSSAGQSNMQQKLQKNFTLQELRVMYLSAAPCNQLLRSDLILLTFEPLNQAAGACTLKPSYRTLIAWWYCFTASGLLPEVSMLMARSSNACMTDHADAQRVQDRRPILADNTTYFCKLMVTCQLLDALLASFLSCFVADVFWLISARLGFQPERPGHNTPEQKAGVGELTEHLAYNNSGCRRLPCVGCFGHGIALVATYVCWGSFRVYVVTHRKLARLTLSYAHQRRKCSALHRHGLQMRIILSWTAPQ